MTARAEGTRSDPGTTRPRLVVVNPASSSGRTAVRWQSIEADLRAQGVLTDVRLTEHPGHAIDIVRSFVRGGGRDVIVLGGDGSVNEAVAGCVDEEGSLLAQDITLAVIHQGTGGDFARGIGIPRDTDTAIDIAAHGDLRPCDLGVARYVDDQGADRVRAFVSCANVGMGADVVARVTGNLKRLGDSAAFGIAAVWSLLTNGPRPVRITVGDDHVELDIVDILVANNRYVGGGMFVAPDAQIDDGLLDAVIISRVSRARLLMTFPKIYRGTHINDPLVRVRRSAQLSIDSLSTPQGVVLDGELVGHTPVQFSVLPGALKVRVCRTATIT